MLAALKPASEWLVGSDQDQIWTRHTIVLNAQVWSGHHPKLIPDPIGIRCFNTLVSLLDLGSGVVTAEYKPL
jgi:hypothetical protein